MELNLCDKQYNYTDISYNSIIVSLVIIYSITISVILFFIKQLVKDIKKKYLLVEEKDLLSTKEEDLLITEEEDLLITEEEDLLITEEEDLLSTEEEDLLITEEENLLITEEEDLLIKEEELLATKKELLPTKEELLLTKEEELLLANYNKKERAFALQEAYKEKLDLLLKKKNEINTKLENFNKSSFNIFFNIDSSGLPESVVNKILLLRMIYANISTSISKEMPSNEEILRTAKKAGVFESPYDILELLKIRTSTFDNGHPFYDEYKEVLLKI